MIMHYQTIHIGFEPISLIAVACKRAMMVWDKQGNFLWLCTRQQHVRLNMLGVHMPPTNILVVRHFRVLLAAAKSTS